MLFRSGSSASTTYIHSDHLGSTRLVTDENGSVIQSLDYAPFGLETENISSSTRKNLRNYIGQLFDPESRLSYLSARYYDGGRGQFLSQDPVFWEVGQTEDGKAVLQNPQAQNSYSYAQNNPIVNKDPTGRIAIGLGFNGTLGVPGLYGGASMYGVLTVNPHPFSVQAGIISSADGGGATALGGVGGTVGPLFSNARNISELEGPDATVGGSVRAGADIGVDIGMSSSPTDSSRTVVTVTPGFGFGGTLTPYVVPAEVHGGASYSTAVAQTNLTQSVTNGVNAAKTGIQNQLNSISNQIKQLQKAINSSRSSNSKSS